MEKGILMQVGNQTEKFNNLKMIFKLIITIFLLSSCGYGKVVKESSETEVSQNKKSDLNINEKTHSQHGDTISNKNIYTNKTIDTTLNIVDTLGIFNKRLIGKIVLPNNTWYLVSGKSCEKCDENTSIYLLPAYPEKLSNKNNVNYNDRFDHPGKVFSYDDNTLVYESSTFFGKCLNSFGNIVIWVDREINESGEWEEGVYMIQIFEDKAVESRPNLSIYLLEEIEKNIAKGKCFEIEEIDQVSES
ncbi:hypothetical protein [Maribacter sp. 2308TA10-17]|uniref:hypothetical protein n=1 Tax=Maribacter sp. 2308TA10-17 TaxID=3386276 RepID=UPI0039BCF12C